jgi:oligopeptide transport system substrate-binding protein
VPPGTGTYTGAAGLAFNADEARRLLAEAGYPGGRGFPPVTFLYNSGELQNYIAVEIKSMLKDVLGVDIRLRNLEWKVYLNAMDQLDYDFCRASWIGDYNDPNTFLDCFVTGGGNNRTGWSNPEYDRAIDLATREPDVAKRNAVLQAAETLLVHDSVPIAPLYHFVGIQFYDRERLGGLEANVLDEHPFRRMYWRTK